MSTPNLHGHLVKAPKAGASSKAKAAAPPSPAARKRALEADAAPRAQEQLHARVAYLGKGSAASEALAKCAAIIERRCVVPDDFLLDKVRYGPLGGISFEQRLMANYRAGTLAPKAASAKGARSSPRTSPRISGPVDITALCSECAAETHWRETCPSLAPQKR